MGQRGDIVGSVTRAANDNAIALDAYLGCDEAQAAEPRTVLAITRLAKCGAVELTADQLLRAQRIIDNG